MMEKTNREEEEYLERLKKSTMGLFEPWMQKCLQRQIEHLRKNLKGQDTQYPECQLFFTGQGPIKIEELLKKKGVKENE